jgi:hypothetical protein
VRTQLVIRTLLSLWVLWAVLSAIAAFLLIVIFPANGPGDIGHSLYLLVFAGVSGAMLLGLVIASVVALARARADRL